MGVYRVKVRKNPSRDKEIYLEKENDDGNKLELYLNDVYKKECAFKVDKEEVDFIRAAIEDLVSKIAVWILDYLKELKSKGNVHEGLCEIMKNRNETTCPCEIIGAGSFYEGSRICFPDEFDFIFPLYCCESSFFYSEEERSFQIPATFLHSVFLCAFVGLSKATAKYKDILQYHSFDRKSKVYFDQYMDAKGPASKLQFIYSCSSKENRKISVDFVPAIKVIGNKLKPTIDLMCQLREFKTEILITGEYLLVQTNTYSSGISFSTTETRFLKTVLSRNHKKVFKILKYLLNGHEDGEKLEKHLATHLHTVSGSVEKIYSSYMIKTMIIHHHYTCTNSTTDEIGPCVLQVLDNMSEYADFRDFPSLTYSPPEIEQNVILYPTTHDIRRSCMFVEHRKFPITLVLYLQSISVYLRLMRNTIGVDYDYEKVKLKKSAAQMYLDDLMKDWSLIPMKNTNKGNLCFLLN